MAKSKKSDQPVEISIDAVTTLQLSVQLIGTSPLLLNRLAEKARHELLLPAPPKNRATKQSTLKHRPHDEYRSSAYTTREDDLPTRIVLPGGAFRKAIASAALDIPGSSKAQIGRLVRVVEYNVFIYGVPRISCMIVRQAGINRTPDVRTRAILPEWCCELTLRFAHPLLKEKTVLNLLSAAGDFIGVGDGRNEKGSSLSCGCFRIATDDRVDQKLLARLQEHGGRKAQDAALAEPESYDRDTEDLLLWFDEELQRRGERHVANSEPEEEELAEVGEE